MYPCCFWQFLLCSNETLLCREESEVHAGVKMHLASALSSGMTSSMRQDGDQRIWHAVMFAFATHCAAQRNLQRRRARGKGNGLRG